MASIVDRVASAITYFTFGIFGIIWLIYVNVAKKPITKFAIFNIYQSFFVSIIFAVINIGYDFLYKLCYTIGFLRKILTSFDLFFNGTPIYQGYSISGLIITIFIGYLVILTLLGKRPFIPFVSNIIEINTGV